MSLHPSVTRDDVQKTVGWHPRFADSVHTTEAPTKEELSALRDLHSRTRGDRR